jgi:hypothetical protein
VTGIFAGDEISAGDEGREGGASFAEGEADANYPRCSLPPVAAAKAPGEKAAGENAAATAVKAAAAAEDELRCQAACDLHAAKLTYTPPTPSGPAVARAAAENAAAAAEKAATAEPPPEAFRRRGGEPVGARADWPHLLTFCRHID